MAQRARARRPPSSPAGRVEAARQQRRAPRRARRRSIIAAKPRVAGGVERRARRQQQRSPRSRYGAGAPLPRAASRRAAGRWRVTTSQARISRCVSPGGKPRRARRDRASPAASRNAAPPSSACSAARLGADRRRDRRHRGQTLRQRAQIEPGAADHDRQPARGARGVDLGERHPAPAPGRARARRRRARRRAGAAPAPPPPVRPRGQDREIAIDLHAVGIDDRAAETFGERQRQRRFAGAVGPAMMTIGDGMRAF